MPLGGGGGGIGLANLSEATLLLCDCRSATSCEDRPLRVLDGGGGGKSQESLSSTEKTLLLIVGVIGGSEF